MFLQHRAHGHSGILGRTSKGTFDSVLRQPCKVGPKLGEVLLPLLDLVFMGLIQPGKVRNDGIFQDGVCDEQVKDMNMTVVTFSIKGVAIQSIGEIRHCIIPLLIVGQVMVQYRWVPISITSQDHMSQGIPFIISVGPHFNIRQTTFNIQGNDIAIKSFDVLLATNLNRPIIHKLFVPFELTRRMDSLSFTSVGILVHNGNDFTTLCFDDCTSCNNGNVNNLVVINTLHINLATSAIDDTDILTSNASVCATINKGSCSTLSMARGRVKDVLVGIVGHTILDNGLAGRSTFGHGLRKDSLDVTRWDILFLGHVCKQGGTRSRVWFRGDLHRRTVAI